VVEPIPTLTIEFYLIKYKR